MEARSLETRVTVLETTLAHINESLQRIETNLEKRFENMERKIDTLKCRLDDSNDRMVSHWIIGAIIITFGSPLFIKSMKLVTRLINL